MSVRIGWVCALFLLLGCGGKQPAKPPTPATTEPGSQAIHEAPDLSPVKRPSEVVVVGRVARPRVLIETLSKWSAVPFSPTDLVPSEARGLAPALSWDAPIDLVVALDPFGQGKLPEPLVVASIGMKSLQDGLNAADRLQLGTQQIRPGIYRLRDLPNGSCALAASAGAAPARLVCGKASKDVEQLLPYATRGLAIEPQSGADFELTLDAAPIQARYGNQITALRLLASVAMREVALDTARFDRALSDAIYGGVDEAINLFADLEQIRIESRLDTSRSVLLGSAEVRLKGNASWVAGTLAAAKPVPVPATLPRLPLGASAAWFSAAMPAERYTAINRIMGDLAEGYLEHEKLPEATRKRARKALEPWLQKMPESFGFTLPSQQKNADGSVSLHPETTVTRMAEPSASILAAYGDLFALLQDPAFKRWAQDKAKLDAKAWPKVTKKPLKLAGFKTPATVFEATTDLKAWSGSSASIGNIIKKWLPNGQRGELVRYLVVVQPDGPFTYVCLGDSTAEIARAMAEHRKTEPGAPFARPARNEPVLSAGFLTIAGLARALERGNDLPELRRALVAAPQRGETPVPFSTSVGPGMSRFDFELPAAALGDLTAMAISAGPGVRETLEKRPPAQPLQ